MFGGGDGDDVVIIGGSGGSGGSGGVDGLVLGNGGDGEWVVGTVSGDGTGLQRFLGASKRV